MKRVWTPLLLLLSSLLIGCTTIEPGHVGIVVNQWGSDRGVASYTATTGVVTYNPISTRILEYPTYVQTAKWTASHSEGNPSDESITFTNRDGMQFSADISLSYHLMTEKVPAFYVKFRSDDMDLFTHGYLRNVARDKFDSYGGKYSIEQIMGDNAEFLSAVHKAVQAEVASIGIVIDQFGLIGAPRPPAQIQQAINQKAAAAQLSQQKENELKQVQADAAKRVAETEGYAKSLTIKGEAEAAYNKKVSESMSERLLEKWRLDKWDGALPQVNGGSTNPFISLEKR